MTPDTKLGLSCLSGGQFYVCSNATVRFLGCCHKDPCADGSGHCPPEYLAPTSYNVTNKEMIQDQQCEPAQGSDYNTKTYAWYRCDECSPPIFGCCSDNLCNTTGGCPLDRLTATVLSEDPVRAAVFLGDSEDANTDDGNSPGDNNYPGGYNYTSGNDYPSGNNTIGGDNPDTQRQRDSHADIKVAVPVTAGIVIAIALIVFFLGRKRKQRGKEEGTGAGAELGKLERRNSTASSIFMRPRPAPTPPPVPPLPQAYRTQPSAVYGHADEDAISRLTKWSFVDDERASLSPDLSKAGFNSRTRLFPVGGERASASPRSEIPGLGSHVRLSPLDHRRSSPDPEISRYAYLR